MWSYRWADASQASTDVNVLALLCRREMAELRSELDEEKLKRVALQVNWSPCPSLHHSLSQCVSLTGPVRWWEMGCREWEVWTHSTIEYTHAEYTRTHTAGCFMALPGTTQGETQPTTTLFILFPRSSEGRQACVDPLLGPKHTHIHPAKDSLPSPPSYLNPLLLRPRLDLQKHCRGLI